MQLLSLLLVLFLTNIFAQSASAQISEDQGQKQDDLNSMRQELNDLKTTIMEGGQAAGEIENRLKRQEQVEEFKLVVKEGRIEIMPGIFAGALCYNKESPGPVLRAKEGDLVSVTVFNESRLPTSFYIDGLRAPYAVSGLPKQGQGLINPGQSHTYQFTPERSGLYFYHPQINHLNQKSLGLYGTLIVEPDTSAKIHSKEAVLVIGQWTGTPETITHAPKMGAANLSPSTYFTVNGKSAPAIPTIVVDKGERMRLYVVNATSQVIPLVLSGHRFEVVAINGSDEAEPHIYRDSYCLQPCDRVIFEFLADNPGVWSLASQLPNQSTNNGKFPGGIAIPVRYSDFKPE